jgi:HEAT repeat protein
MAMGCFAGPSIVAVARGQSPPTHSATARLERLRSGLREADVDRRLSAIHEAFTELPEANERPAILELLITALEDPAADVRGLAAEAIGTLGSDAASAIGPLIALLPDLKKTRFDARVAALASRSLGRIGEPAIEPLRAAVIDSDNDTYRGIMGAFAEMKGKARTVVPLLIELLRSCPEDRRWATIYALHGIGVAAEPAVPDLIIQLDHESFNIQVIACRALAEIGPASRPAVPKLLELIQRGNVSTRSHAAMCLGAIGPVEGIDTVGVLVDLLKDGNQLVRERTMTGLGKLGAAARSVQPTVEASLSDPEFWPKPEAAKTLWLISGESNAAVAHLIALVDSPTFDGRVLEILAEMGPAAREAAPHLAKKLQSDDQGIRLLAVQALGAMGPAADEHVEALRACVASSEADVQAAVKKAIDRITGGDGM